MSRNRERISGRGHIATRMTMPRCCRCVRRRSIFSFTVKTEFASKRRFDQCGIVMYLDSENWLKASIEYETREYQRLGSVATNHGYSDWATTDIPASVKSMWYRFSRRESDYCIECSEDGVHFKQMRICHMWRARGDPLRYLRLLAGGVLLRGKVFHMEMGSVQVDGP